jgi:hypothetical protein
MRHNADKVDEGTVFRVWADGKSVEIMPDEDQPYVYASVNSLDIVIDRREWFTVSDGYTNQHGYRGPVMHNSEFISEGMMQDILEQYDPTSHYFVTVYPTYDDGEQEGWVLLAKKVTV